MPITSLPSVNLTVPIVNNKPLPQKENITIQSKEMEAPLDYSDTKGATLSWSDYRGYGSAEDKARMIGRFLSIYVQDMPLNLEKANQSMALAYEELYEAEPSLKSKSWDVSVDSNNELVIIQLEQLSKQEVSSISKTLNKHGLKETLSNLKGLMIETLETQRGPDQYSTGIGRYELNKNNFDQIVRFKEFLISSQTKDHFEALADQVALRATDTYSQLKSYSIIL